MIGPYRSSDATSSCAGASAPWRDDYVLVYGSIANQGGVYGGCLDVVDPPTLSLPPRVLSLFIEELLDKARDPT